MTTIRTDRLWDLSQPVFHDRPAWFAYDPAFPVLLRDCGGAWTRAVAWELA